VAACHAPVEGEPVEVVERPQERRERLARARRRYDERVPPRRDGRPAFTLWCRGLRERRVEPGTDEWQKLGHVRSLYPVRQPGAHRPRAEDRARTIRAMRIVSIGGGPAGLYFAILMKQAHRAHAILVVERNRADDTLWFGVVFSDATLEHFQAADRETHAAIARAFAHWNDIDTQYAGQTLRSTGHGFAGMSRQALLTILQRRCAALGVTLGFSTEGEYLSRHPDAALGRAVDGATSAVTAH